MNWGKNDGQVMEYIYIYIIVSHDLVDSLPKYQQSHVIWTLFKVWEGQQKNRSNVLNYCLIYSVGNTYAYVMIFQGLYITYTTVYPENFKSVTLIVLELFKNLWVITKHSNGFFAHCMWRSSSVLTGIGGLICYLCDNFNLYTQPNLLEFCKIPQSGTSIMGGSILFSSCLEWVI